MTGEMMSRSSGWAASKGRDEVIAKALHERSEVVAGRVHGDGNHAGADLVVVRRHDDVGGRRFEGEATAHTNPEVDVGRKSGPGEEGPLVLQTVGRAEAREPLDLPVHSLARNELLRVDAVFRVPAAEVFHEPGRRAGCQQPADLVAKRRHRQRVGHVDRKVTASTHPRV